MASRCKLPLQPGRRALEYALPRRYEAFTPMKNLILPLALVLLAVVGCASSQDTRLNTEPRSYDEAMEQLSVEIVSIDKHIIGAQYRLAVPEAERAIIAKVPWAAGTLRAGHQPWRTASTKAR